MIPKLIRKELEPLIELIPQAIMDKWNLTPESIMEDVMHIQDYYFKDAGFGDILAGEIPYYIQYGTYNKLDKKIEGTVSALHFTEFHYRRAEIKLFGHTAYIHQNMLSNRGENFTIRIKLLDNVGAINALLSDSDRRVLVIPSLTTEQCNQALRCSTIEELQTKFLYKYEQ